MHEDPAAAKRRLLRDLRQSRAHASLTQKDVADELEWSPSKVIRIEKGEVAISTTDLRALLQLYKIEDRDVIDDFVSLARSAKRQSSWDEYRDLYPKAALTYFAYESSASIIRQYEPLFVPGLLQIPEYTQALTGPLTGQSIVQTQRHAEARALRQEMFDRDHPPQTFFILDEAVIRRIVGTPAVMRRQLAHLEQMAELPTMSIQIVPFSKGSYPGLRGSFTLLGLGSSPEDADAGDTALFLESRDDQVTRDDPELIGTLIDTFWDMERNFASPPDQLHAALLPSSEALKN